LKSLAFRHALDVELRPGDICYITGVSGAGKSVLLREMYNLTPEDQRVFLDDIPLESDKSLIDIIDIPLLTPSSFSARPACPMPWRCC